MSEKNGETSRRQTNPLLEVGNHNVRSVSWMEIERVRYLCRYWGEEERTDPGSGSAAVDPLASWPPEPGSQTGFFC